VEEKRKRIKRLVEDEKKPLRLALRAMNLNKATYYYSPKPQKDRRRRILDEGLTSLLQNLCGYDLVYGYRKVTDKFEIFNHKKVYRHMKALGMLQPKKLKKKKVLSCLG
jgi:hypothetical protein